MSQGVSYSASQQDLFYPAKSLDSFPTQRPKTDAELCAWMALLAHGDLYSNFAFAQDKIKQKLGPLGFKPPRFFESKEHERNAPLRGLHDDAVKENKLAVVASASRTTSTATAK
jgi:hypothetical protein